MMYLYLFLGILFLILSGIFDAQKDYAKATMIRFVEAELYAKYYFYFNSGNGGDGWKFKWKNGNKDEGEAFKGSNTHKVYLTDWFHFAKKVQILFIVLGFFFIAISFPVVGLIYEILNYIGFNIGVSSNKTARYFINKVQLLGLRMFLKTQKKHNAVLLSKYLN